MSQSLPSFTNLTCAQFFLRSADADVEKYLKLLTFLPLPEIGSIMQEHAKDQSKRVAQHKLAQEFVELVHGWQAAEETAAAHRRIHNKSLSISDLKGSVTKIDDAEPLRTEDDMRTHVKLPRSLVVDKPLGSVLWSAGLAASRSEGHRLIRARGAYGVGADDTSSGSDDGLAFTPIEMSDSTRKFIIDDSLLVLRAGKSRIRVINVVANEEFERLGLECPGWNTDLARSTKTNEPQ
jgi:tyrosyl-tRNA synthetase